MKHDNLYTGSEGRSKLISGIKKVAQAVGSTMGTGGSNAIIEAIETPGHLMTNDGYSIANAVVLADPIEEMGRKILVESINRANKSSGDGSSTTAVLTAAIIEEGLKHVDSASPMEIKRSLEACVPMIEKSLKDQTRSLFNGEALNLDLLQQVATISAEDEEIGKRIAEIYVDIGKDGIIHWDISKTAEDTYTLGHGLTVEGAGYYSPYMCDATESGQSTNQVRLNKATVLLTKQKIASAADFNKIGQDLFNQNVRDVVVFCDEIDPLVVPDLIKTRAMRGFRFIIVKMPVLWKEEWYEDLSLATGAKIVDPAAGLPMNAVEISDLGHIDNIVITKDDTYIDGIKDLSAHVAALEAENTDQSRLRASRLNTKTARYFVGAHSDSALSYRRLKVEDAISAAWQALNGGIVAGGGVALINVLQSLPADTVGGQILRHALKAPMHQIITNTGYVVDQDESLGSRVGFHAPDYENDEEGKYEYLINGPDALGFNSKTQALTNMIEAGIVDPSNIVLNSIKNAISVAATVLTANTIVILPRQEEVSR